jgi:hypothetical protein
MEEEDKVAQYQEESRNEKKQKHPVSPVYRCYHIRLSSLQILQPTIRSTRSTDTVSDYPTSLLSADVSASDYPTSPQSTDIFNAHIHDKMYVVYRLSILPLAVIQSRTR